MLRQPQKVGILGGGQLGKMLAMEAVSLKTGLPVTKLLAYAQDDVQLSVAISAATLLLHCVVLASLQQWMHCANLSDSSPAGQNGRQNNGA